VTATGGRFNRSRLFAVLQGDGTLARGAKEY